MFIKQLLFSILLTSSLVFSSFSQKKGYSKINFHPPIDIPMVLAANFGELRSNHFHTGIDFKTNRQTGYNIFSIADGYVSRIKVSPWGYGQVVYIDHYNGLTSVYAHCESFEGKLGELVKAQQEKKQNFEIEYYPAKDSLKVKKGQVIAKSGNTGGSTAPHLHFEIRETKSEHALNPLLFNFDVKDTRKPTIRGVKVYALTPEGYRIQDKSERFNVYGANGSYNVSNNKIQIPAYYTSKDGGVGFAFDAIDQLNDADNICGIFKAALLMDGDTIFTQNMTEIHFSSNRQINTHKDYEEYHNRRKHYQKAFKTIHNPLPIYRTTKNNGILNVSPNSTHQMKYICEDVKGNKATLTFELEVLDGEQGITDNLYAFSEHLFPDSAYMDFSDQHYVLFPPGLLYEPTSLEIGQEEAFHFGDDEIPLQESFKLMLPIENQSLPNEKYYIKRINSANRTYTENGTTSDGWITKWIRDFGRFEVAIDTIPPTISRRNFINKANVRGKTLIWKIEDEASGLVDYDVYIDGKWHLLSWEPKRQSFYFDSPSKLTGTHKLLIKAVDACGNISQEEYELEF
jgi:murein DD-endopeptidase MepM/ murein hydrolase activator NlpD